MESLWFLHLVSVSFSDESMMKTNLISVLILLLVYSCARNEDTLDKYIIAGTKGGIDTTAPTVSSTSPSDGAITSISNISATFSEVVDKSTLTTSTFTLTDNSSNCVSGTVSSSDNTTAKNTTVTFTPSSMTNGSHTATVSNSVKDLAGNSLAQNYSWSFENKWVGTRQLGTLNDDIASGVA
ncbi:MAG TPA: hypothetical protein EYN31_04560, partial [Candidatus Marinimicrobia bacterium]|nr:hypothetical protein [Candidatus Neomarinimicrobiota bacterium]